MRRPLTPKNFYRVLQRISDGKLGATERAFLRSVQVAKDAVRPTELRAAISSGSVENIVRALGIKGKLAPTLRADLTRALTSVITSSRVVSDVAITARIRALKIEPGNVRSFTVIDPGPTKYLAEQSGYLIREIDDSIRTNIRRVLVSGTQRGWTVKQKADEIEGLIGLTSKQFEWVEKRREKYEDKGWDPDDIQDELEAFEVRLIKQRAQTIARTETMKAANEGHDAALQKKIADGSLQEESIRREWSVTPDDRLCWICEAIPGLNPGGVGVSPNSLFITPIGAVRMPPAHPQCRCVTLTVFVGAVGEEWARAIRAVHGDTRRLAA